VIRSRKCGAIAAVKGSSGTPQRVKPAILIANILFEFNELYVGGPRTANSDSWHISKILQIH
jgi:hypothetical protein